MRVPAIAIRARPFVVPHVSSRSQQCAIGPQPRPVRLSLPSRTSRPPFAFTLVARPPPFLLSLRAITDRDTPLFANMFVDFSAGKFDSKIYYRRKHSTSTSGTDANGYRCESDIFYLPPTVEGARRYSCCTIRNKFVERIRRYASVRRFLRGIRGYVGVLALSEDSSNSCQVHRSIAQGKLDTKLPARPIPVFFPSVSRQTAR